MSERVYSRHQEAIFAAIANGSRHLVCQSYAGSGKTTTAVEGARRIPGGGRVGMTAFGRPTANELISRVNGSARVNTFHGFGYGACQRAFGELALDNNNDNAICREFGVDFLTRRAAVKLVKRCKDSLLVREPLDAEQRKKIYPAMWALADEAGIVVPSNSEVFFDLVLDVIDGARNPRDRGTISYDDMLWLPIVHGLPVESFPTLLIDEGQDMNNAQLAMALKMRAAGGRIVVFGDSHQAIYGFRGAHEDAMSWLGSVLEADRLELPECYRCCRAVVKVAQRFVPQIQPWNGAEEGQVGEVHFDQMLAAADNGDFVLSRSNAGAVTSCLKLLARGKPARIRGKDFGETLTNLIHGSKCDDVDSLRGYVEKWKAKEVERLTKEERDPQTAIDKADCLMVLSEGEHSVATLVKKIGDLFQKDVTGITCSTIHGAKGLEADRVWLLGASFKGCHYHVEKGLKDTEGTPEIERARRRAREENNISYVAVTRAKRLLCFVDEVPRRLG